MPKSSQLATSIHLPATPPPSKPQHPKRTYLIYYIPGNPGLIEFYRQFLTYLYGLLTSKLSPDRNIEFRIYGRSLSGFETARAQIDRSEKENGGKGPPYDVEQQISITERHIRSRVQELRDEGFEDVRVIVMGHSLGTYISMEMLRRLRASSATGEVQDGNGEKGVRVAGGVLLFTTIMNIEGSPSGKRLGWFFSIPFTPIFIHYLVKVLTLLVPTSVIALWIRIFNGHPPAPAHVVASLIKSPNGMRQMLYLAQDEMKVISKDKWDEEVWGAAGPSKHPNPRPILRFLFGKNDDWVANETRDALIKARGGNGSGDEAWKPKMEIDDKEGWPHDFIVHHSVPVAERVYGYVEDIVKADFAH